MNLKIWATKKIKKKKKNPAFSILLVFTKQQDFSWSKLKAFSGNKINDSQKGILYWEG